MSTDTAAIVVMAVLWGGFFIGAYYIWKDKRKG